MFLQECSSYYHCLVIIWQTQCGWGERSVSVKSPFICCYLDAETLYNG